MRRTALGRPVRIHRDRTGEFPLAAEPPSRPRPRAGRERKQLSPHILPAAICARACYRPAPPSTPPAPGRATRAAMIALQEELDWRCYRLYGLHDDPPEHPDPPGLRLGERAFEMVMARRIAAGDLETAWFDPPRLYPDH